MARRPIKLETLLELVDSSAEREVERAKATFNRKIRDVLRHDMALVLEGADAADSESSRRAGRVAIPVRVEAGYPTELQYLELGTADDLEVVLQGCRVPLEEAERAIERLGPVLDALRASVSGGELADSGERAVASMNEFLTRTLLAARAIDPVALILAVDQDILGSYGSDRGGRRPHWATKGDETRVALYWPVIALVAQHQGVPVMTLATIVLAHELAHAYSHRGADIEGHGWDAEAFFETDRFVLEGLAQYYTAKICERLESSTRGITDAFNRLVTFQTPPYRVHQAWLAHNSPEAVRFAMLTVRRRGVCSLQDFERALAEAERRLPKVRRSKRETDTLDL